MRVTIASEKNSADPDSFVAGHDCCVNYHRWASKHVIEGVRMEAFYLTGEEEGKIIGVLPLVC